MGGKGLLDDSQKLLEKGKATVQEGVDMIISGDISTGLAMVDKGKQTTQTGADKAEDELSTEEDEASRTLDVLFNAFQNQHYGFDGQYGQSALQPQYESLTHKDGTYYIAWKSVIKGATDQVIAIADNKKTDTTQTTYRFKTAEGLPVNTTALPDTGKYKLNLTNNTTAGETYIEAHKTIPAADSGQSPTTRLAGHLNLAVYEGESFTLQLVPMGDASCLPAQVQTALNDIYQQAAVTWQVSAYQKDFSPTGWDEDEDGLVKSAETQFLSNYTSEMNNIIDAFKKQANPDRKTYYLFLVPGFSDDLAGFMPLCRNYGFIATENATTIANTIGHELGHGAFVLYHPFSDKSPYYRPEGSTDNLMDYSGGTFLNKYQWDLINDPRRIVRVMQDEGEGMKRNIKKLRRMIELIRFGYACNRNIKLGSMSISAKNIILGDNNKYNEIGLWVKEDIVIKNIQNNYRDYIPKGAWDKDNESRIGFGYNGERGGVEFVILDEQIDDFKFYITNNKTEQQWLNAIDNQIDKYNTQLINLEALPDDALKRLTNSQRISILKAIIEINSNNFNNLAVRIVNNVQKDDISDFFSQLEAEGIIYYVKDKMSFNDYTAFIKAATLLFYKQSGLKTQLKNLPFNRLFVHQARTGTMGASINNTFKHKKEELVITGNCVILKRSSKSPYQAINEQTPNSFEEFTIYNYNVGYCELIGLELVSNFGHLNASMHNDIIPLPAFYFDWIKTNIDREKTLKTVDAAVTIASLAIGIGELQAASKVGKFMFGVKLMGVVKSSVDLVLLNNKIVDYIEKDTKNGEEFLLKWEKFGILFDFATFDIRNIDRNKTFFKDLVTSWSISKELLNDDLDKDVMNEIEQLMLEIENEIKDE